MSSIDDSQNHSSHSYGEARDDSASTYSLPPSFRPATFHPLISPTPLRSVPSSKPTTRITPVSQTSLAPSSSKSKKPATKNTKKLAWMPPNISSESLILDVIQLVTPRITILEYLEAKELQGHHVCTWASNNVPGVVSYSSGRYTAIYVDSVRHGFRLLLHPFFTSFLTHLQICQGQLVPNNHLIINCYSFYVFGCESSPLFFSSDTSSKLSP